MTSLHQHFGDALAMQSARPIPTSRADDPAYRRRQLARRLRPWARAVTALTLGGLYVLTIWLFFIILAALPI